MTVSKAVSPSLKGGGSGEANNEKQKTNAKHIDIFRNIATSISHTIVIVARHYATLCGKCVYIKIQ